MLESYSLINIACLLLVVVVGTAKAHEAGSTNVPIQAELIEVKKIWNRAPHSAFTDLIRWRDRWYCAFREGENHVGSHGKLRILVSSDGSDWRSAAILEDPVYDLRDANLSMMPDGKLMAVGGAQIADGPRRKTGTFASYSNDGSTWTKPELIMPVGRWMWGVTWYEKTAWGVSYGAPVNHGINSLMASDDGLEFSIFVQDFFIEGDYPTEARIRFAQDGTGYCLQRTDGEPNLAYLGSAKPPYKQWTWKCLETYVGGPNLLQLPSGDWIAAGRLLDGKRQRTALLYLDVECGSAVPILDLPSGGDCSYPGLVWHEGRLWMSYYSSHGDRTSIYLAQIDVTPRNRQ